MQKVELKPLREYLLSGRIHQQGLSRFPAFFTMRHLFSSTVLAVVFFAFLILTSPFSRTSRVGACAIAAYAVFIYIRTQSVANGLFIKRVSHALTFSEGEKVEMVIELTNASAFSIAPGLIITDVFEPSLDPKVHIVVDREIPSYSKVRVSYKRSCDGGMGEYQVGPISAHVCDPQGLVEFRVHHPEVCTVRVYPKVQTIPDVPMVGSPSSTAYGAYEVIARGASVTFAGVRPYAHGDALRHISWRLSMKRQHELMVKEFEKIVNSEITIVLNLDSRLHAGYKSSSTWEAAKDIAIAIASQQLALGNTLQILSNHFYIEPARGNEHLEQICRKFMNLMPDPTDNQSAQADLIRRMLVAAPRAGTVFYISAFDELEFQEVAPVLASLRLAGSQVFCIYLDAKAFLSRVEFVGITEIIGTHSDERKLNEAIHLLAAEGIITDVISHAGEVDGLLTRREAKKYAGVAVK